MFPWTRKMQFCPRRPKNFYKRPQTFRALTKNVENNFFCPEKIFIFKLLSWLCKMQFEQPCLTFFAKGTRICAQGEGKEMIF